MALSIEEEARFQELHSTFGQGEGLTSDEETRFQELHTQFGQPTQEPEPKEAPGFWKSVETGITDVLPHLAGGAVEAVGEATDIEALKEYGKGVRERQAEEMATQPKVRWKDVSDASSLWEFAKQSAGEGVGPVGAVIGGAAVGGAVGGPIGAIIGGGAAAWTLGTGEVQSAIKEINPDLEAPEYAFGGGLLIMALDRIAPTRIGSQILSRFVKDYGKESAEKATKEVAENMVSGRFQQGLKEGGISAATEMLTEPAQELVSIATAAAATDTEINVDELWDTITESAMAGMFGGAGPGFISGVATYGKPEVAPTEIEPIEPEPIPALGLPAPEYEREDYIRLANDARNQLSAYNYIDNIPTGSVVRADRQNILMNLGLSGNALREANAYWSKKELSDDAFAADGTTREGALQADKDILFEVINQNEQLGRLQAPITDETIRKTLLAAPDVTPSGIMEVAPSGEVRDISGFEAVNIEQRRRELGEQTRQEEEDLLSLGLTPDIQRLLTTIQDRLEATNEFKSNIDIQNALDKLSEKGVIERYIGDGVFANLSDKDYRDSIAEEISDKEAKITARFKEVPTEEDIVTPTKKDIETELGASYREQDAKEWIDSTAKQLAREEKPKKGKSFSQYVSDIGVLPQHTEDLQAIGIEGAAQRVINKGGKSLDEIGESAFELGYFDERPTEAEVLDALAIDVDATKDRVYPIYGEGAAEIVEAQEREALEQELDTLGTEVGVDWRKARDKEKAKIKAEKSKREPAKIEKPKEIITEPTEAGEQIVLPEAQKISEKELVERRMAKKKEAKVAQKPADEGLFDVDARKQIDLIDEIEKPTEKVAKLPISKALKDKQVEDEVYSVKEKKGYSDELQIDLDFADEVLENKKIETPEELAIHNTIVEIKQTLWDNQLMPYHVLDAMNDVDTISEIDEGVVEQYLRLANDNRYVEEIYNEHLEFAEDDFTEQLEDAESFYASESVIEWASASRGITDDIHNAGYVLPNGKLLDFTDWQEGGGGGRTADHRELNIPEKGGLTGTDLMDAFLRLGPVRIDAESGLVHTKVAPTAAQYSKIKEIIDTAGGGRLELYDGDRSSSVMVTSGASAGGVIRKFYRGEAVSDTFYKTGDAIATSSRFIADKKEIKADILSEAQRINPDVNIEFVDNLFGEGEALIASGEKTGERREVAGAYSRLKNLVTVSLDTTKFDPTDTGYHELWHSLEDLLTTQEKTVLLEKYPASDKMSYEENVATAFAEWAVDRKKKLSRPAIKRAFNKIINFLVSVGNVLRGKGFHSVESVFETGFIGEIGAREGVVSDKGVQYSIGGKKPFVSESRLKEAAVQVAGKAKKFVKKNFTKEGLLTDEMFERTRELRGVVNEFNYEISNTISDFESVVSKAFGKKKYKDIPEKTRFLMNDYLKGEKVDLPSSVKEMLDVMRAYIDTQSASMQDAISELIEIKVSKLTDTQKSDYITFLDTDGVEGKIPEHLKADLIMLNKIESNKGHYLNRSYQAFDDPKWKETVLKDKRIIGNAEKFIAENNPDLNDEEVTGAVSEILQGALEKGNPAEFMAGGKIGAKDVSFLKRRKDVPVEIRELLGEYKDVKMSFLKTTSKMNDYITNHNFLMNIFKDNLGVILFERATGEFYTKIASEGSSTMNPLNGLRTTADIAQALSDLKAADNSPEWLKQVVALNASIKYGKTILSPTTQSRNFISAAFFALANGHFDFRYMKMAGGISWSEITGDNKKWREYVAKATKLGVMRDGVMSGELQANIKYLDSAGWKSDDSKFSKVLGFSQKLYGLGDDFWKIVGFENEISNQMKHKGLTRAQAEIAAAKIITDTYPTYSKVARAPRAIGKFPLMGTFVSFPWEAVRTYGNIAKLIHSDYKGGNKKLAAKRAVGLLLADAGLGAVAKASMMALGIDNEEDETNRMMSPEWEKHSDRIYLGYDEHGNHRYLSTNVIDPYTYIKTPINALFNRSEDDISKRIRDSVIEMAKPFLGLDMSSNVVFEIIYNKKYDGGSIYKENDDSWEQTKDIVGHLRKLSPGFVGNLERMYKAVNETVSRSGKKYTMADELLSLGGIRTSTIESPSQLLYKGYEFSRDKSDSSNIMNYELGERGRMSEDDIADVYYRSMRSRDRAFDKMSKIVYAMEHSRGMTKQEIFRILSSANLSRSDIGYLIKGETPMWSPSRTFLQASLNRAFQTTKGKEEKKEIVTEYRRRRKIISNLARDEQKKPVEKAEKEEPVAAKKIDSGDIEGAIKEINSSKPSDVRRIIEDMKSPELKRIQEKPLNKNSRKVFENVLQE